MSSFYEYLAAGSSNVSREKPTAESLVFDEVDETSDEKEVKDDSPWVQNLRNLYRASRINKEQYVGGLATLVATGMISKAEFTRLKKAAI